MADPVYQKIDEALANEDWHEAVTQVQYLDLTHVGEENKDYIKHMLLSSAIFGSKMLNRKGPQFMTAGTHDATINRVTSVICQYLEHRATAQVQAKVLQLIARTENAAKQKQLESVQKGDSPGHPFRGNQYTEGSGGYDPTTWDSEVPPAPGTAPIPDGNVRLYHQTDIKNLDSIAKNGITLDHARGIEGPSAIYADEKGFYGSPEDTPTVEFSVPKDQWDAPFVLRDVTPKDIVAIHAPWHRRVRYLTEPRNKETLNKALSGEFDDLTGDYAKAVQYVKEKYGKAQKFNPNPDEVENFPGFVLKYNPNHVPAGSPDGGQFTSADGAAGTGASDGQEGAGVQAAASDGSGGGVGASGAGEGKPEDARTIEGIHYSAQARETLEGSKFGSGADSQEAQRVKYASDPRIKNRIYAYIDEGHGVNPESGVGGVAHKVTFTGLYDMRKDPGGYRKAALIENPADSEERANSFESKILDAGYRGYFVSGAQGNQGVAILLGDSTKGFKPDGLVKKSEWAAILKFNANHDERGRFSSGDSGGDSSSQGGSRDESGLQLGTTGRDRFDGLRLDGEDKPEQIQAADNLFEGEYKSWARSLSKDEGHAVDGYVGSDFRPMNAMLRGQPVDPGLVPSLKEAVANLSSALDKAPPVAKDFYTYRGCGAPVASMLAAGTVFKDEGFVSTSLSPLTASKFSEEGGPATLLRVHVPEGAKGAYVSTRSDWMREGEFLLPAGSQFKITGGPVTHKVGEVPFDGPFTIGQEAVIYDAELVPATATKSEVAPSGASEGSDKFTWGLGDITILDHGKKSDAVPALKFNANHDEQGRFASSDSSGGSDFVEGFSSRMPDMTATDMYHGTAPEYLDQILKEGLTTKPETRNFGDGFYTGTRGEMVYVTSDPKEAHHYGEIAGLRLAEARTNNPDKAGNKYGAVVLEISVPEAKAKELKPDSRIRGGARTFPENIPPEWITGYTVTQYDGYNKVSEKHYAHKADTETYYAIILTQPTAGVQKDDLPDSDLSLGGRLNPIQGLPKKKRRKADDTGRYVMPFVSFADPGEGLVQMISSLNTSRLATWGFTAEAQQTGATQYQLSAVLDGRTSAFCEMIDGRVFEVADASSLVNDALSAQDPADLEQIQPWPDMSKEAIAAYAAMDESELTDLGLNIPPFHPNCRTMCVSLDDNGDGSGDGSAPAMGGGENNGPLDDSEATAQDFQDMGLDVTDEEVQHWNDYVGLDPAAMVAALFNLNGDENALDNGVPPIDMQSNGNVAFNAVGDLSDGTYDLSSIYDPYSGTFYLDEADFTIGDVTAAENFLSNVFSGMVDTGMSAGASSIVADVGESAYDYAQMGFLPQPDEWQNIRMDITDSLKEGDLKDTFDSLDQEKQDLLTTLLNDPDEHALQVISDLDWDVDGTPIGEVLMNEAHGQFYLDLSDDDQVARAQEYFA